MLDRNKKTCYRMSMIERDPITEWGHAIERRVGAAAVVVLVMAFLLCLVAPLFGPLIKQMKRRDYALYSNYEARAEADMKFIRPILWVVALIGWCFFFYCQAHYP